MIQLINGDARPETDWKSRYMQCAATLEVVIAERDTARTCVDYFFDKNNELEEENISLVDAREKSSVRGDVKVSNFAELISACKNLIDYRDHCGALNFQLEKADDFMRTIRVALENIENKK